jgi:integron integrase
MEAFHEYLVKHRITSPKQIDFYMTWVRMFLNFSGKHPGDGFENADIDRFLKHESRRREKWQVKQAKNAIETYRLWKNRQVAQGHFKKLNTKAQWKAVAEDMHKVMRLRHLALRTEQAYIQWVRKFYDYLEGMPPGSLNSTHVKDYMTHLAVETKVSASTQNQAFNALLFLFRYILDKPIEDIRDAVRAKRRKRLPVILTRDEIDQIFNHMKGAPLLMVQLLYGGGLRRNELFKLRVKDLDFKRGVVVIREGKGDKDRETVLPVTITPLLEAHLSTVRELFEKDRANDVNGVEMPSALERKMPNAGKEWPWFWVFPSRNLSPDPRTGIIRRHHAHPTILQKHIKTAAQRSNIHKRVTVHTFRHSFATHLVEDGTDIRTVQELLGHRHLETTMIYTHVAATNKLGIVSPLDKKTEK